MKHKTRNCKLEASGLGLRGLAFSIPFLASPQLGNL